MSQSNRVRDPERSRLQLLEAAFDEMYEHGFQGARVDRILENARATKGAFYHHFRSKHELAYAVIDEILFANAKALFSPLERQEDSVLARLAAIVTKAETLGQAHLGLGCPVNNLALEMSPLDEGFRQRIEQIFIFWERSLVMVIKEGQATGEIRADVPAQQCALFFIAAFEGCVGLAKNKRNEQTLQQCLLGLRDYIAQLRA